MSRTLRLRWLGALAATMCVTAIACSHSGSVASESVRQRPPAKPAAAGTDSGALESFVRSVAPDFKGQPGHWTLRRDDVEVAVVADAAHDRMRVLAPVGDASKLAPADLATLLDADFDRALDAKYATRQGVVWAVYVHPLSSLTREEFESAVNQVIALRKNYGTTFSSTSLVFAPSR
jgi:hypothetical protein